jgi:hypothetical protein
MRSHLPILSVSAALMLAGCATPVRPAQEIAKAEQAVRNAEASEAPTRAPIELDMAREKLAHAQRALEQEEYRDARHLAEEAAVDAELAEMRAESSMLRSTVADIERSLRTVPRDTVRP